MSKLPEPKSHGINYTPVEDYDDFVSYLGEGFHTALRKAGETREAHAAWQAISRMCPQEWNAIVRFVANPTWLAMQGGGLIRPNPAEQPVVDTDGDVG